TNCNPCLMSSNSLPHQPTSPLFPYTTLFRSSADLADRLRGLRQRLRSGDLHERPVHLAGGVYVSGGLLNPGLRGALPRQLRGPVDRKSTRLNSSHVKISYAVFCLIKKQQRQN